MSSDGDAVKSTTYHSSYVELRLLNFSLRIVVSASVCEWAPARVIGRSWKVRVAAYTCFVLLNLILGSCSESVRIERVGDLEVQVDAPGGGKLGPLEEQPLTINVDVPGDNDAWARGRYFFQHYTTGESIVLDRELSSDPLSADPYKCHIFRKPTGQGAEYTVSCNGTDMTQSRVAAQNIARFLESGVLSDSRQFFFR
jgi:hypothetical protein